MPKPQGFPYLDFQLLSIFIKDICIDARLWSTGQLKSEMFWVQSPVVETIFNAPLIWVISMEAITVEILFGIVACNMNGGI